jgi:hypothetical protein
MTHCYHELCSARVSAVVVLWWDVRSLSTSVLPLLKALHLTHTRFLDIIRPLCTFTNWQWFSTGFTLNHVIAWVPVTTAWHVLRLRAEEWPPIWRVAVNILNKQSRTADKGWSSSLGVGWGANNSSLLKRILLWNIHWQSLRPGLILWYDLSNERETWDFVLGMLGACVGQVYLRQQPGNWLDIN